MEQLHGLSIDQGTAIAQVHVVTGHGAEQAVYLLVHHALADGHHALALLHELWTAYTAIVAGGDGDLAERPDFPVALEDMLAERGYPSEPLIDPAAAEPAPTVTTATSAGHDNAGAGSGVPALTRAQLSAAETTALIDYGHRTGRTVNQLVSAAFIAATAAVRGIGTTRVLYGYPVDLRRRLGEPAAGFTDVTNALGMAFFQAETEEPSLDELAAQVGARLAGDLEAGLVQRPMSMAAGPMGAGGALPEDCAVAVITNWGPVPHLPTPEGLSLSEFYPAFHLEVPDGPGAADWAAMAAKMVFAIVSSFDGRLNVDLSGGDNPTPLATEVLRNLRAFTLAD
ncbi:Acyltransferase PapA5 OS=Tsukamurella paurometabola (strain ATCC 8368 / DSM / CCUG 35730 / CIP 100753 / JCM 10117 / KCTC 9821 / NBRC 16120 / NCIMB 702349/ NCTC 13040) OX=521096 GN=Tpau_1646 PE=4 SV=1 [Tsukamurella paurometabola]|uniref:Acyltransferase PapA5 n=1 Tax=Tsukamurella paurometabola (strain ATCC 8368 / DSM 20162 / CCUG 35730 / CIP 100753 / JCM 10117 / KCTC 9821 / NBRC 16120 / NCIMB 702349 / NCTC 13040) TaxID=521096 RepID=D5UYG0_TSUPD|nr:acyltransferase PapA5 [Tsukamurella paurometabola]ADG78267.1 acyltransferase PapA5 [Tsukamurella paurometabola DSM 20162]SUP30942.1 Phthiocerol/phthiodiolone dimycocerosyl transferase [Tsukamurella paurometabola]